MSIPAIPTSTINIHVENLRDEIPLILFSEIAKMITGARLIEPTVRDNGVFFDFGVLSTVSDG